MAGLVPHGCDYRAFSCSVELLRGGFLAEPGIKHKAEVPVDEASVTRR